MNTFYIQSPHLQHHGILGMHWGIRRYQPYPKGYKGGGKYIGKDFRVTEAGKKRLKELDTSGYRSYYRRSDKTIKKGTTINRVGYPGEKDEGRAYATVGELNKQKYIKISSEQPDETITFGPNKIELVAKKDLKVSGIDASVESFLQIVQDYPLNEILPLESNKQWELMPGGVKYNQKYIKEFGKMVRTGDIEKAKEIFDRRLIVNDEITKAYFNDLASKGYDAIMDFHDSKIATMPIIIFDKKKSTKTVSNTPITKEDIAYARDYVEQVQKQLEAIYEDLRSG